MPRPPDSVTRTRSVLVGIRLLYSGSGVAPEVRALDRHWIDVTDLRGLAEQLIDAGVAVPMSGPVSARMYANGGEHPRRDETAAREE